MSRLSILARHPRRTLTALAVALAAVGVAVGSGAGFTASSSNPGNVVTAGNLTHTNPGGAVLTADKLKPGQSSEGTLTISNTGNVPGTFSLTRSTVADTVGANSGKLSDVLQLKVEDVTVPTSPVTLFGGSPSKLLKDAPTSSASAIAMGTIANGSSKTYKFTVTFPDGGTPASDTTGDNAYKGSSASVDLAWTQSQ